MIRSIVNTFFIIWIGLGIFIILDRIFSTIVMKFFLPLDYSFYAKSVLTAPKFIIEKVIEGDLTQIEVVKITALITFIIMALLLGISAEKGSELFWHIFWFLVILFIMQLIINPLSLVTSYGSFIESIFSSIDETISALFIDFILLIIISNITLKISSS